LARYGEGRQFGGYPCNRENTGQAQGLPLQDADVSIRTEPSLFFTGFRRQALNHAVMLLILNILLNLPV
jgi:hypothetical protein